MQGLVHHSVATSGAEARAGASDAASAAGATAASDDYLSPLQFEQEKSRKLAELEQYIA